MPDSNVPWDTDYRETLLGFRDPPRKQTQGYCLKLNSGCLFPHPFQLYINNTVIRSNMTRVTDGVAK
jgi:hypothetical protein